MSAIYREFRCENCGRQLASVLIVSDGIAENQAIITCPVCKRKNKVISLNIYGPVPQRATKNDRLIKNARFDKYLLRRISQNSVLG